MALSCNTFLKCQSVKQQNKVGLSEKPIRCQCDLCFLSEMPIENLLEFLGKCEITTKPPNLFSFMRLILRTPFWGSEAWSCSEQACPLVFKICIVSAKLLFVLVQSGFPKSRLKEIWVVAFLYSVVGWAASVRAQVAVNSLAEDWNRRFPARAVCKGSRLVKAKHSRKNVKHSRV